MNDLRALVASLLSAAEITVRDYKSNDPDLALSMQRLEEAVNNVNNFVPAQPAKEG